MCNIHISPFLVGSYMVILTYIYIYILYQYIYCMIIVQSCAPIIAAADLSFPILTPVPLSMLIHTTPSCRQCS